MPSIRVCSKSFSLSRTTVETAYDMLAAEGYIISKPQSGYFVCFVDYSSRHRYDTVFKDENANQNQIKFDLVSNAADKSGFNFSLWRRYVKSALRQDERLLSYGKPQGEDDLRRAISDYISKERGVVCSAEQIVVAAGTQNLIGILSVLTAERKNVSFVGSTFERGKAVFEDYGKTVSCFSSLSALKSVPQIIYTSPSHSDSWGGVMNAKERKDLLNFANKNNCLVVEDDYDSEFRYFSKPEPSLQGMNGGQNVVYIGTFSKLLLPSIRISFMVLPLSLIDPYKKRGNLYNQTASKTEQIALCSFIRDGHLASQIRKQKKQYIQKTKYITEKAALALPKNIRFETCRASYLIRVMVGGKKTAEEICSLAEKLGVKMRPVKTENNVAMLLISVAGFDVKNCDEFFSLLSKAI